jgi:hypothetical protein
VIRIPHYMEFLHAGMVQIGHSLDVSDVELRFLMILVDHPVESQMTVLPLGIKVVSL